MSIQPDQASPAPRPTGGPEMRASDADRETAAGLLSAAFAEGRLTAGEHGQRLEATYAARTRQQLHQLTADLPAPPGAAEPITPTRLTVPDRCLLCVLLCLCPPVGIAWRLLCLRRPKTAADTQLTPWAGPPGRECRNTAGRAGADDGGGYPLAASRTGPPDAGTWTSAPGPEGEHAKDR